MGKAAQKPDFDKTIKKVEGLSNTVDIIMRNRLIIAIFLIVDGVTFILNPNSSLAEMAKSIILLVILAAFSILIANLTAKTKDRKTIIMSVAILAVGIFTYIYPDLISAYMQLILSLFIIYDGAMNILKTLNMSKYTKYSQAITKRYNDIINRKKPISKEEEKQREKFKDVSKNFDDGLEQQASRLTTPLKNIVNKTDNASTLYIVANAGSVILGIILLVFPDVSMVIWGIIFLYTGISNFLVAMKTMNVAKMIKEKKFKEIVYGGEGEKGAAKKK